MCRVVVLLILGPVHTYTFLTENGDFFPPVWPTVDTYLVKMVMENASFQRRTPESLIFNCDNCH